MPFVSADIIPTGFKVITVENKITNLQDFPDYVFVSVEKHPGKYYIIKLIGNDGLIPEAYKFSSHSVYAIKRFYFNEASLIKSDIYKMNESDREVYNQYLQDFFSSSKAKEVITGISTSINVPISSTQEKISKEYSASLTEEKAAPDNTKVQRNNLVYAYLIAPIIALFAILYFIFRKKNESH